MAVHESRLGRFYEEFTVGDVYRHPLGRTISETDNTWFTLLTMNTHPAHFDAHYAGKTPFGKILVNSGLTIAMLLGQSVSDISQRAVANLAMTNIQLTHPVFVGDTLYGESICTAKRESKSKPYAGLVEVHTRGLNAGGDVCLSFDRTVLVFKQSAAGDIDSFPAAKPGPLTLGEVRA
ncbi:MaoC family dehydratase [Amycolatopsis echigonensis]|uniref:Acyl dehydratase n=1 Tax=Amycolatopsis echigonensis TaxID=2576905 RepID=A0A2N3WN12_9PSEU|nr:MULTISPECIES: MaoC family dehydratase [Amycolatopsis]MBB2505908.1 MaoC family dehydratase [Amycolatopsis echigonensis]PKV95257.1 acyl dehydratase [Amycolatopsis niigatensis]